MTASEFLTVREVAEVMRVSRMTIYRIVKDEGNPLGAVKIRGGIRISQANLDRYLQKGP